MKKEIIRVEPLAMHHEPETGEIFGDSFVMAICLAIYLRKRLCDCSIPLTVTTRRLML
jgi:hypothetical protein